ncbi:MAG: glycosyltransferase family 4 protein [Deltaproteobacteria bacterium]|nr:glycosyltransferase family 4 protein [Deltaproteobacteria bacterium]MBN2686875.1 glycosyltransferase family 4 protein [Deltaproteobacteria bacterium]
MKILIVVNEYPPEKIRGTAMATEALAKNLAKNGWKVYVIVTCRGGALAKEIVEGITVYRLNPSPITYTRTIQRFFLILRLTRKIQPDIIQGQAISCGLFAALVGKILRIPSVTYIQGRDFYESGLLRRYLEVLPSVRYATKTIAVTDELARGAEPYAGRSIDVIPHGYQPSDITGQVVEKAKRRMKRDVFNILSVGHFEPDKGTSYLLSAIRHLKEKLPGMFLHLVGDGPLRTELEMHVQRDGISEHVCFYGSLSHPEVLAMMRVVDLFVLPSVEEAFGIVLIEALNQGCPVVASRIRAIPTIIEDGVTGILVPPRDPEAISQAAYSILTDREMYMKMKQVAHSAGEKFRWDFNVKRFERVYQEILK